MKAFAVAGLVILSLALPAIAGGKSQPAAKALTLEAVNGADLSAKVDKGVSPVLIKMQVLLDRARFSPGVIDGRNGENVRKALAAFEAAQGLKADGQLDEEVWGKLNQGAEPVLVEYTIREEDVKGPFAERIPEKFEEKANLDRLAFTGPEELLAEKFHLTQDLLKALNPGKSFDKAGTTLVVPNVEAPDAKDAKPAKAARIEIDKSERILRALGEDGKPLAIYPASIGSEEKPAPSGSHTVRAVAQNPNYTYNPDYAFKGVKAKEKFEIKPGPNNPVGTVWIDLTIESFGIHGTPEPEKVGKAYSHGCVRLTNWDVEELAKMVQKGTPVVFQD